MNSGCQYYPACNVHCVVNWLYILTQVHLVALFSIADAEENLGESEVREAHLAKSLFYIRIGDKVGCHSCGICLPYFMSSTKRSLDLMWSLNSGESIGATQSNRKQDSGSWTKDGLGILHASAWLFLHGFWSHFQKHR